MSTKQHSTFGQKLSAELTTRGLSKRRLARMLSENYGQKLEDRRRTVVRWIDEGRTPLPENRHMVEDVLGVPRDSLKGDDEDEEEPMLALLRALRRVLREARRATA